MLLFLLFFLQSVYAAPQIVPLPNGLLVYKDNYVVHKIRHTEIVDHQTDEGQKRVKSLRKNGYNCLRNKPKTTKCWFDKSPESRLPEVAAAVKNKIMGISFEFPQEYHKIEAPYDGATTQEWIVRDTYKINNLNYSLFTLVHTLEDKWFITLPIDEEQYISVLNYHSAHQLGLTMIASSRNANRIVSYFIEAFLE